MLHRAISIIVYHVLRTNIEKNKKGAKMAKVILRYDLPEEADDFKTAFYGIDYKCVLFDIDEKCRGWLKYGHHDNTDTMLEEIRDMIIEVNIHK